ncbi:MAG: hypothetical protein NVSMB42_20630 [Herpetosiphon sp.]
MELDTVGVIVARVAAGALGIVIVFLTVLSTIRTFMLPRSTADQLTRHVFALLRTVLHVRLYREKSFEVRDRVMALYAPVGLLAVLFVWLCSTMVGFSFIFFGLGIDPWEKALVTSGSSLLTLGFASLSSLPVIIVAFAEAMLGLVLVALLIGYLPTMYTAFARREAAVSLLDVRAGNPPSAVELLLRFRRLQSIEQLDQLWHTWEEWFIDIEESHTSLAALAFFRSPQPQHSWVTAAGAVLDAAALQTSTLDVPRQANPELCIRAGYLALRRIAQSFRLPVVTDPGPETPITVSRAEWEVAYERMAAAGIPLKADRDKAWEAYRGWRVNYDMPLIGLAVLTMAPSAPWSSDRVQHLEEMFDGGLHVIRNPDFLKHIIARVD